MRLNVLFWNYNSVKADQTRSPKDPKDQARVLAQIVAQHHVDIVTLAENDLSSDLVLEELRNVDSRFNLPENPHRRFKFFTRFPGDKLKVLRDDERISIRRLILPGCQDILLAAIHYYDRRNCSKEKQHSNWLRHRETLLIAEKDVEHRRMILFGDFNMNPYEIGMTDPVNGIGAMMTEELARLHSEAKGRFCFYNPMWALMGRDETPGTFYWDDDDPLNPYWNCLDGVLVRPELIGALSEKDVQIIDQDPEGNDLIRLKTLHWTIAHSDHLPVLFSVNVPDL